MEALKINDFQKAAAASAATFAATFRNAETLYFSDLPNVIS